jgi:hypothetical protein
MQEHAQNNLAGVIELEARNSDGILEILDGRTAAQGTTMMSHLAAWLRAAFEKSRSRLWRRAARPGLSAID